MASVKANDTKPMAMDTILTVARAMTSGCQPMGNSTWGVEGQRSGESKQKASAMMWLTRICTTEAWIKIPGSKSNDERPSVAVQRNKG